MLGRQLNIVTQLCPAVLVPDCAVVVVRTHVDPSLAGFTSLLCWLVLSCGGFLVEDGLLVQQLVLDSSCP